jgi:hypothetical protein
MRDFRGGSISEFFNSIRKYRSLPDGLANGSSRPVAVVPGQPPVRAETTKKRPLAVQAKPAPDRPLRRQARKESARLDANFAWSVANVRIGKSLAVVDPPEPAQREYLGDLFEDVRRLGSEPLGHDGRGRGRIDPRSTYVVRIFPNSDACRRHAAAGALVLHDTEIAMDLAVLPANRGAQKHDGQELSADPATRKQPWSALQRFAQSRLRPINHLQAKKSQNRGRIGEVRLAPPRRGAKFEKLSHRFLIAVGLGFLRRELATRPWSGPLLVVFQPIVCRPQSLE